MQAWLAVDFLINSACESGAIYKKALFLYDKGQIDLTCCLGRIRFFAFVQCQRGGITQHFHIAQTTGFAIAILVGCLDQFYRVYHLATLIAENLVAAAIALATRIDWVVGHGYNLATGAG